MIPRRIYVKGFMSYRDEAELTFDGASLWVLKGKNGAGKSAVFDAVIFALYGRHRGGKQNHSDLINHQADNLIVEFDFLLGHDMYRARRTVAANNRSTRQVFHLNGPNAPYSGKKGLQPVPETDTDEGFRRWIDHNIGLNDETFTASILLQQGKSDKMLNVSPADRHKMLSELVDLSIYQRIEKKARDRHKHFSTEVVILNNQLNGLEPVDAEVVTTLQKELAKVEQELNVTEEQLEQVIRLQGDAKRWEALGTEKDEMIQVLAADERLFFEAAKIEARAKRLAELNEVLPTLRRLYDERERRQKCKDKITANENLATELEQRVRDILPELESNRRLVAELHSEQGYQQQRLTEALKKLQLLEKDRLTLVEMETLKGIVQQLEKKINKFPFELDDQVERTEQEVARLRELQTALPWLRKLAKARHAWNEASTQQAFAQAQLLTLSDQLTSSRKMRETLEAERDTAVERARSCLTEQARRQTLLDTALSQRKRFSEVEGQPTCQYCGQDLSPEHLDLERTRIEQEVSSTETNFQQAQRAYRVAIAEQEEAELMLNQAIIHEQALQQKIEQEESKASYAQNQQKQANHQAEEAVAALPEYYHRQVQPKVGEAIIAASYPAADDLATLEKQAMRLKQWMDKLHQFQARQRERDELRSELKPSTFRLEQMETSYPPERIEEIETAITVAEGEKVEAEARLEQLRHEIVDVENVHGNFQGLHDTVKKQQEQAQQSAREHKTRVAEVDRLIGETTERLPEAWQLVAKSFTAIELQSWNEEAQSLDGADEQMSDLVTARRDYQSRQARLNQIDEELSEIPEDGQRSVVELENIENQTREQKRVLIDSRQTKTAQKQALEARQERRQALEKQRFEAAATANLYKELSILLGRDRLQRHLLRQVEEAIVENANEVLDKISGGTLWLDFRQDNDGKTKALDIVAHNNQTADEMLSKPLPVEYLSGSQRFRVAVSLALGIGRYANHGMRQVEAVIIDEGFGGLDSEGRGQMVAELEELKQELRRIILVSHQEEFANTFTNGYEIKLEDGTSKASILTP